MTFAKPIRAPLGGKNTVWEAILAQRGWNDLPPEKQIGSVIAVYTDETIEVYFSAVDYTALVFQDEVTLMELVE